MFELLDLLAGIRAHLDDDAPRLVLADWLDEHDDPARAEFIRLQVQLARWVPDLTEREALQARENELLVQHQAAWLGPEARLPNRFYRFERGLIHAVRPETAPADTNPWVVTTRVLRETDQGLRTPPRPQHPPFVANERRWANALGMWFQRIPAGTFRMGTPTMFYPDEHEHLVTLTRPFSFSTFPVTQREWQVVTGRQWPETHTNTGPDLPATGVTWDMAAAFCQALSDLPPERAAGRHYRLPTEAEWEYACRAGTRTEYHFGDGYDPVWMNGYGNYGELLPVGCFDPNAFGVYDLHGQVREWCLDWYVDDLRPLPAIDPVVLERTRSTLSDPKHLLRGGSWDTTDPSYCRSSYRLYADLRPFDTNEQYQFGFGCRVVCTSV